QSGRDRELQAALRTPQVHAPRLLNPLHIPRGQGEASPSSAEQAIVGTLLHVPNRVHLALTERHRRSLTVRVPQTRSNVAWDAFTLVSYPHWWCPRTSIYRPIMLPAGCEQFAPSIQQSHSSSSNSPEAGFGVVLGRCCTSSGIVRRHSSSNS